MRGYNDLLRLVVLDYNPIVKLQSNQNCNPRNRPKGPKEHQSTKAPKGVLLKKTYELVQDLKGVLDSRSFRSFTAIRKKARLFCGSFLRKGEVFAYVGLSQNFTDLKDLNGLIMAT